MGDLAEHAQAGGQFAKKQIRKRRLYVRALCGTKTTFKSTTKSSKSHKSTKNPAKPSTECGILNRLFPKYCRAQQLKSNLRESLKKWKSYSKALDKTPVNYLCPLSKVAMTDPVMCSDGTTYDRKAIMQWFKTSQKSPLTGGRLANKKLIPNMALKSCIL